MKLWKAIPQATADTTEHSAGAQKPQVTQIAVSILVYNMYDKDEEIEDNFEEDIKE